MKIGDKRVFLIEHISAMHIINNAEYQGDFKFWNLVDEDSADVMAGDLAVMELVSEYVVAMDVIDRYWRRADL